jgi:hypothetical protein
MLIVYLRPTMVLNGVSKSTGNVNASPAEFVLTLKNSPEVKKLVIIIPSNFF